MTVKVNTIHSGPFGSLYKL